MDWADRIGRRIRLRDLHILLAVAERGSMAKASASLSISHPVISKTIADLERTVGVKLFDRNAQGVQLTIYGQALLECGVTVFDEMRQGLKQIEQLSDPASGELTIGCPEITMAGLLPPIVERFSRQYPHVRLNVILANTALAQFGPLRERSVDLLIGRMPRGRLDDDLKVEILYEEPYQSVVGAESKWAKRRQLDLGDILNEPWVLPPYDSAPGVQIHDIFTSAGFQPPEPAVATLSVQLTVSLIASGRYVGILPMSAARFNVGPHRLKLSPVKLTPVHSAAGIITLRNRTMSPLAELFMKCARDFAQVARGMPVIKARRPALRQPDLQGPGAA
jgi:DNA-binding transcriptional LysR family regulator